MDSFVPDQSGINSLGGFSYQIKVFVFYMLSMSDNIQVEFEAVDDVSVRKLIPETIDDNEDKFRNLVMVLVRKWGDRQLNQMSNSPLILTSRFV